MVTRSIATVSLSGTLEEKLRVIAAANFDAVEIFENDLLAFDRPPRDVAMLCKELGLSICAFQPFRDFEGMPEPQRARNFVRAERKFDLMQELGTDLLLVCSNVSPASQGGIDRAAADFRELGERAKSRGLRVGFEALAWGRHVSDYRDAWEIVRRADHTNVGVVLDSFHILAPGFPLSAIRSIPGDRIFLVQLADAPRLELDVLSWSRHHRSFPGQGDLPVGDFMDALAGVQHIAFTSNDIFATVARIREQGAVLLDIPDNYYDDLEAKYDFAPGVAKALRDNHILYDRDDSGEFFQAYTRVFDDRFFFEIVQRKNYSGFGAPNAAIRLAAQYREARPAALLRI